MKLTKKLLQDLKERKIFLNDLAFDYFVDHADGKHPYSYNFRVEIDNMLQLLNNDICDFKQIIDKFKDKSDSVGLLIPGRALFEYLIENNKLTAEDVKYLLNGIVSVKQLDRLLTYNGSLLKHILSEFILDKNDVDRFTEIIENNDWCKERDIHSIFDVIDYKINENNEELLKLNELNKIMYSLNSFNLNKEQKLNLIEVIQNSEFAQNTLKQLVENNLQDQYNFETLEDLLTKDDKKKLKIKFNF